MSFILANFLGNSPANSDQVEDKQLIIEKIDRKNGQFSSFGGQKSWQLKRLKVWRGHIV